MKNEHQKLNQHIAWRIFHIVYAIAGLGGLIYYAQESLLTWSIPWYFKHMNDINAIYFPTKELFTFLGIIIFFIIFYFVIRRSIVYISFNK